jgi:serine protease Do
VAGCQLQKTSCGVSLLARQAELFARLGDISGRERAVRAALALNPSPTWREALTRMVQPAGPTPVASGTGFAVAPGYVVTNLHVVQGDGAVKVRLPGRPSLPAAVVASDERCDLALLKVELPSATKLPAARVAPRAAAGPGAEVATLGYALGAAAVTFTKGTVSQRDVEPGGPTLLLLDLRVNPGNSGGPLFDACGNVVGVVSAKTAVGGVVDSYGLAVAADALDQFLRRHLKAKEYASPPAALKKLDWSEAQRQVRPSVVQVLKEVSGP